MSESNSPVDTLFADTSAGSASASPASPAAPAAEATPPAPAPEATPAAPAAVEPPKHDGIPMAVALDWRDELKATKKRLAELEARPAPQAPSVTEDPEAFARYQADLVSSTRTGTIFDVSETMAREKHGDEPVTKAMDWAMQQAQLSPAFAAEYLKQKHPIDWAVKQQKRHALLDEMGDDPEAYVARKIAEKSAAAPAASQAQPAPAAPAAALVQPVAPKPTPRPSLASSPSAGGHQTVPTRDSFDATFPQ